MSPASTAIARHSSMLNPLRSLAVVPMTNGGRARVATANSSPPGAAATAPEVWVCAAAARPRPDEERNRERRAIVRTPVARTTCVSAGPNPASRQPARADHVAPSRSLESPARWIPTGVTKSTYVHTYFRQIKNAWKRPPGLAVIGRAGRPRRFATVLN